MGLIVTQAGAKKFLSYILNKEDAGNLLCHCFSNNRTPLCGDVLGLYTEPTGDAAYHAVQTDGSGWAVSSSACSAIASYPTLTFNFVSGTLVYGVYYTDINNNTLLGVSRFANPVVIFDGGGSLSFLPSIKLAECCLCPSSSSSSSSIISSSSSSIMTGCCPLIPPVSGDPIPEKYLYLHIASMSGCECLAGCYELLPYTHVWDWIGQPCGSTFFDSVNINFSCQSNNQGCAGHKLVFTYQSNIIFASANATWCDCDNWVFDFGEIQIEDWPYCSGSILAFIDDVPCGEPSSSSSSSLASSSSVSSIGSSSSVSSIGSSSSQSSGVSSSSSQSSGVSSSSSQSSGVSSSSSQSSGVSSSSSQSSGVSSSSLSSSSSSSSSSLSSSSSAASSSSSAGTPGSVTRICGTGSNNAAGGACTNAWTNPTRIQSDDNSVATCNVFSGCSQLLVAQNFLFSGLIPAGATITGLRFIIEGGVANSGSATVNTNKMFLNKAGTPAGNDLADFVDWASPPTTIKNFGGPGELWGTTWTVADVTNANFGCCLGVAYSYGFPTVSVDCIKCTVYYTV